jgi:hypothetical protein
MASRPQNTIDWAAGLDFTLPAESRFNVQIFQRQYFNYDSNIISDKRENGYSLLFNTKIFTTGKRRQRSFPVQIVPTGSSDHV